MQYEARTFSKDSYDLNDKWAKDLIVPFLIDKGYTIVDTEEDFEHDIKTLNDKGEQVLFEIEVKTGYSFTNRSSFPFDSVSFTGRKERLHQIKPFHYIIICRETQWAVTALSDNIYIPEHIEDLYISTDFREGEDQFYRVPKEKCSFFKINVDPMVQLKADFNHILNSSVGLNVNKYIKKVFEDNVNDLFKKHDLNIKFTMNWGTKDGCVITGVQNMDNEMLDSIISYNG